MAGRHGFSVASAESFSFIFLTKACHCTLPCLILNWVSVFVDLLLDSCTVLQLFHEKLMSHHTSHGLFLEGILSQIKVGFKVCECGQRWTTLV